MNSNHTDSQESPNSNSNTNFHFNSNRLTRYDPETSTCYGKYHQNFVEGFFGQFQDSFCYTFILQFLAVLLMYSHVGSGKYWKLLFYSALAGLYGAILENGTVAFICRIGVEDESYKYVVPFLIDEIFWISNEYSIPLLNLIKMKVFDKGRVAIFTKYIVILLILPFIYFRICIGYHRMKNGFLQNEDIHAYHGYAFAVIAISDIICTFGILYYVRISYQIASLSKSKINLFIKHSSYTILIAVDVVSVFLSITNIISNVGPWKNNFPGKLFTPFHCLKCSAILILAIDAFIFKYGAIDSTVRNSINNSFDSSSNYYYNVNHGPVFTNTNNNSNTNNSNNSVHMAYLSRRNTDKGGKANNTIINLSCKKTSLENINNFRKDSSLGLMNNKGKKSSLENINHFRRDSSLGLMNNKGKKSSLENINHFRRDSSLGLMNNKGKISSTENINHFRRDSSLGLMNNKNKKSSTENINHFRRDSSLGMMNSKSKRSSTENINSLKRDSYSLLTNKGLVKNYALSSENIINLSESKASSGLHQQI
ncbi:hypothetical protein PIROE2DRAFT_9189 [Piromyces sp. E2]|nr:hypothetical protein PIROE2DRAFT_9189 [Piromyces sp. E2]|eukprot:OUM64148.1 hypothetical protein PIROE2DRAFT_9189 [Piromyces sp. E2]